jgi:hypothetical protein
MGGLHRGPPAPVRVDRGREGRSLDDEEISNSHVLKRKILLNVDQSGMADEYVVWLHAGIGPRGSAQVSAESRGSGGREGAAERNSD